MLFKEHLQSYTYIIFDCKLKNNTFECECAVRKTCSQKIKPIYSSYFKSMRLSEAIKISERFSTLLFSEGKNGALQFSNLKAKYLTLQKHKTDVVHFKYL